MTSESTGRWTDLLGRLGDADPHARAAAAVEVTEALGDAGIPELRDVLAELTKCDAVHPGVADAFYGAWLYGAHCFADEADRDAVKCWVLLILEARPPGILQKVPNAIVGNDLEFYAHEIFEADARALTKLLERGYVHVVEMALDHTTLERSEWIALVEGIYGLTQERRLLESMAIQYGVVHADLVGSAQPFSLPGGGAGIILASENERFWEARWIFPFRPARLDVTAPHALFAALVAAGLEIGSSDAPFDRKKVDHLAFPEIPDTHRIASSVRVDTQMTIALNGEGTLAIRIVRTKADRAVQQTSRDEKG